MTYKAGSDGKKIKMVRQKPSRVPLRELRGSGKPAHKKKIVSKGFSPFTKNCPVQQGKKRNKRE